MLLIKNIKLPINTNENGIREYLANIFKSDLISFSIHKKSLDARKKPIYVYSVIAKVNNEDKYLSKDIIKYIIPDVKVEYKDRNKTIIIVGYGPSGIFSAYRLIEAGFKVIVFEKGKRINDRVKDVELFFSNGILNEDSNVQFGEGGAGTFSDAKLTTRIKDDYISYILDIFIKHGANPSIKYDHHPHIGTDIIRGIISNITDYLISKGCEFHFEEEMLDLIIQDRKAVGIKTKYNSYYCDALCLGIGHSAYETINILKRNGVFIEKKDIAIGFRVEHPQSLIDSNQSNNLVNEPNEYLLRYKDEKGVYSFCMCPGGIVVPAMSRKNTIVTNGMSNHLRDSGIANSAILIQISKNEFEDGYEYLKHIEEDAYNYSNSYKALACNIKDFINNQLNELIFQSSYPLSTVLYDYNGFFNSKELNIIKKALLYFNTKIPGFIDKGIMVGPETRSSSPIRITRDENYMSINTLNLYPMGEGAGYGGGIMSCSLDGIRIANKIILLYE